MIKLLIFLIFFILYGDVSASYLNITIKSFQFEKYWKVLRYIILFVIESFNIYINILISITKLKILRYTYFGKD